MASPTPSDEHRVELYVRSLAATPSQTNHEAVIDRLEQFVDEGIVDEYTVQIWGKKVAMESPAAQTETGQFIHERLKKFRHWASVNQLSITSFFERQDVESSITGEQYTAIVLPTLTLAEFDGDSLRGMAPCTDGDTVYTVFDLLDAIEANQDHDLIANHRRLPSTKSR